MISIATSRSGCAARNAASTSAVCARASSLPRVPRTIRTHDSRRAQRRIGDRAVRADVHARGGAIAHARSQLAEIRHMLGDDFFARRDLLPPQRERLLGDRLQRIDVVKEDAIHFVHLRRHVARHGDVDDEERAIPTLAQNRRELFAGQQRLVGRGGRNQNVDLAALILPAVERDRAAADERRQILRAFARAVASRARSVTPRETKRARRAFAGFAGAERRGPCASLSSPKIFTARSTATEPTETAPRVMSVCVRTCFATRKAR